MAGINRLWRRAGALVGKQGLNREMDEEMRIHVEMEAEELVRTRGMSPQEARRQAMLAFGGVERFREEAREARGVRVIEDARADLRYATRMCFRHPGFAAAAIFTLALGIGATTAVSSVVYGVLLKPLAFHEPDRLVHLLHSVPDGGFLNQGPDTYLTYRDNQRTFEGVGAWDRDEVSITGAGEPERVEALEVTSTLLPLLKVQPVLGRLFTSEDDSWGAPPRVILTHAYWQRRFGGAVDVVGRPLQIDGRPADIIGVLPASFAFPRSNAALLMPMPMAPRNAVSFDFHAVGRLKPGASIDDATADMARMIPLVHPSYEVLEMQPHLRPLSEYVAGGIGNVLWILFGAVGLVLLISCANVANLFLVRAEGRHQELALRAALGANRGRIARVLLSESLLLAMLGGALGLALAYGAVELLRTMAPPELPRVDEIAIDLPVMIFTLVISILSGALFSLLPVLRLANPNFTALKEGVRGSSEGPGRYRTRNALVVAELALAVVLMISSGLLIRTVALMRQVHPGFTRPQEVQTFRLTIPGTLIADDAQFARAAEQIAQRLEQVPGVASVGLSSSITMDGEDNTNPLYVEDVPAAGPMLTPFRRFKSVAPGYFETMGNPVVAGRAITWTDIHEQRPVIVISESLAREYWKDPSLALGERVRGTFGETPWREIVGVVGDERDDGLNKPVTPIVYWPLLNDSYEQRTIAYAVRSSRVGTPGFLRELQQAVWAVNPDLPIAGVLTLERIRANSMARTSFAMSMLAISAGIAMVLGVVGIYAVIAYVAAQRTREIGIRLALGAQIGDVRRMFLGHGVRLTAIGIALGLVAALAFTRAMSALLFGVSPMDPVTYAAVSAVLATVALVSTWLPARRASRVDPIVALRADA